MNLTRLLVSGGSLLLFYTFAIAFLLGVLASLPVEAP